MSPNGSSRYQARSSTICTTLGRRTSRGAPCRTAAATCARVGQLVVARLRRSQSRTSSRGRRPTARHHRDDGARIDAAAQKRADGHVADLVKRDRLGETAREARSTSSPSVARSFGAKSTSQYRSTRMLRPWRDREPCRLELARRLHDAARRRRRERREQMADRFPVERSFDLGELEDWLQLRRKEQLAVALGSSRAA